MSQNPDLERAQNAPAPVAETVKTTKAVEKIKKRKANTVEDEPQKRVQVVETSNVIEVVYDDSAEQNVEPMETEEVNAPPTSDLDWLRARTSRTLGLVSDSEDEGDENKSEPEDVASIISDDDDEAAATNTDNQTPVTPPATDHSDTEQPMQSKTSAAESKILRTGRLFIRNLVYGVTEDGLRAVFSPYGQIEEVSPPIPMCRSREYDDQAK